MDLGLIDIPRRCRRYTELHRPGGDYAQDIASDWHMIEPHLPKKVESIIDIGCGMGGIDIYLKRRFPKARLELVDGNGEEAFYGYGDSVPYSNRVACSFMLAANGVHIDRWHDVGTKETLKADLIISLLAWGFHFPLSAYRVQGLCIADIYRGKDAHRGEVIWRAQHSDRCVWHEDGLRAGSGI